LVQSLLTTTRPNFSATGATTAGQTQYWFVGNAILNPSTVEVNRRTPWRSTGVLSKLLVKVIANTTSLASSLYLRKNGIDTDLGVTIAAGFVGVKEEITIDVSIAAGDALVYKSVSGGTGTLTFSVISIIFNATTNCVTKQIAMGRPATTSASTQFTQITGDRSGTSAVEANMEARIKKPGVYKYAYVYVSANAKTTPTTLTFRKNRLDTAITWTIASGFVGPLENTSTSIIVAAEDEVDWKIVYATDTANITIELIALDFESDDYTFISAGCSGATADITQDFNTTNYFVLGGATREAPNEAEQTYKTRLPLEISNLSIHGQVNTCNGNSTIKFKKNGVYSNQAITIGPTVAGWQADDINIDTITEEDQVVIEVSTGGTAGILTIRNMGVWAKYIPPPVVVELPPQVEYGIGRLRPEPTRAKLAEPLKKQFKITKESVGIESIILSHSRLLLDQIPSLTFSPKLGKKPTIEKPKRVIIRRETLSAPINLPIIFSKLLITEGNSIQFEFEAALLANASPSQLKQVYNKMLGNFTANEQDRRRKHRLRRFRKLLRLLPF
jgi:hypothetical protein